MNIVEKVGWYYRNYGVRPLIVRGIESLLGVEPAHRSGVYSVPVRQRLPQTAPEVPAAKGAPKPAMEFVQARFAQNQPLRVFSAPGPECRINLVTDSVNVGSLFGGVGTAIIIAAHLANARGAHLRVVTRMQPADERGVGQLLECNGIRFEGNIEFSHVGVGANDQLDVCEGDRFLTTSWWTTESVLGSIAPGRIDYLLQEDERMFYPLGDDWLRCNAILSRRDIRFFVNTELLYTHLVDSGLTNIADGAVWFEPAFPEAMFHWADKIKETTKKRLFFYARPNNLRNLYYLGLEVLDTAFRTGVLDPDEWEVVFVGKDAVPVQLGGALDATLRPTMDWRAYGEFIRSVDVGMCLMATPHPSYPPLDLAASGAVVVTNRFGLKQNLSRYSENIILADADVDSLVVALGAAAQLAENESMRKSRFHRNGLTRSWSENLERVVRATS